MPRAIELGGNLVEAGFHRFDTAPTYGAAYAHYVLNRLADRVEPALTVDTKHGQHNELGLRGIAKKLLRAPAPGAFADAFWRHRVRDRTTDEFWAAERMFAAYVKSRKQLGDAAVGVFYYHAPPRPVLGPDTADLYQRFAGEGVRLGLSNPTEADLAWLRANTDVKLVVLMDILELQRHYDLVRSIENVDVRVHGLFRQPAGTTNSDGAKSDAAGVISVAQIVEDYFVGHPDRKFVIGINSQRSLDRLRDFVESPGNATYFKAD